MPNQKPNITQNNDGTMTNPNPTTMDLTNTDHTSHETPNTPEQTQQAPMNTNTPASERAFMLACTRPVGISYWPTQVSIKSTTNSCIEFKYYLVLSEVVKVLFDFFSA